MTDSNQQNPALSKKQQRALPILLSASSIAQGCRRAGINRDTMYEWLKQDSFRLAYNTGSCEVAQDGINSLNLLVSESVEVLRKLLAARSEAVRLKASLAVIDSALKGIEFDELAEKLEEIQRHVDQHQKGGYRR